MGIRTPGPCGLPVVDLAGFEPATPELVARCSSVELKAFPILIAQSLSQNALAQTLEASGALNSRCGPSSLNAMFHAVLLLLCCVAASLRCCVSAPKQTSPGLAGAWKSLSNWKDRLYPGLSLRSATSTNRHTRASARARAPVGCRLSLEWCSGRVSWCGSDAEVLRWFLDIR